VLSNSERHRQARLRFANGCVANLTASRVSAERMRKIRVFSGRSGDQLHIAGLPRPGRVHLPHARDGEEESSLIKKLLRAKDSAIVSEFGGKKDRARTGCPSPKKSLEAGTPGFHRVRPRPPHTDGQRRLRQASVGSGLRDYPADQPGNAGSVNPAPSCSSPASQVAICWLPSLFKPCERSSRRCRRYTSDHQPLHTSLEPRFFGAGGPLMAAVGVERSST